MFRKLMLLAGVMGMISAAGTSHALQFNPPAPYPVFPDPRRIKGGDYNVDGNQDIATIGTGQFSGIAVLLGTGSGSFQPFTGTAFGFVVNSFFTHGNFNSDENPDIATGGLGSDLFFGQGNGTFIHNGALYGQMHALVAGDFNEDSLDDLASYSGVRLCLGNGNFGSLIPMDLSPESNLVIDLNLDGDLDIVGGLSGFIKLYFGNGNGSFLPAISYPTVQDYPYGLIGADFNNDGWPDIIESSYQLDNISILLSTGNGNLGAAYTLPVPDSPRDMVAGDFDEDGNADFAMIHISADWTGFLRVYFGDGTGLFPVVESYGTGKPTGLTSADYNDDGHLDIAVSTDVSGSNDVVYVYLNSFPPPPIDITMTPVNPPIIIQVTGGSFAFTIQIDNNTDSAQAFEGWTKVQLPNGIPFPLIPPIGITLPANASQFRARDQFVPANAPAGNYFYRGFVGAYPWIIADSSNFPFTKLGSNRDWQGAAGWISSGELFPTEEIASGESHPFSFRLNPSHPNPFNPTTVASCEMRAT